MMIAKEEVKNDLITVFSAFERAINLFNDDNFNSTPFENSWTPGQVVEHIILANEGFASVLNAEVATTDRPFDEKKAQIKAIFLNFGTKMQSPAFILPALKTYNKTASILKIATIKAGIAKAVNDLDLSKTCLAFELPGIGKLTRYEAIYFVIYHTQRHAHQLNEIHRFLKDA